MSTGTSNMTNPESVVLSRRRLDIQGLRAIAVLTVIFFHADLPIPGGFVGVDVFFVISGFVITSVLWRNHQASGRISFGRFYRKRFMRLAPALALVVTVTMLITSLVLSPLGAQQNAVKTGVGAMFGVANFVIAFTTGGYFDLPAENNPLLNTWSLSVEEQFYLIFPVLIAFGWVLARRQGLLRFSPVALALGIGLPSFALAWKGAELFDLLAQQGFTWLPSEIFTGFYSPFTRAWEFAAGALLALALTKRSEFAPLLLTASGLVGVVMLVASLWRITDTTPFPGTWTLLPVVGTLLLLFGGANRGSPTSRALSLYPVVKIGDWSYSLYLWHWPLITFAVYLWPQSPIAAPLAALFSLFPAIASYKALETPLRNLQIVGPAQTVRYVLAISLIPVFAAVMVDVTAHRYWVPIYKSGENAMFKGDIGDRAFFEYMETNFYPCQPADIREQLDEYDRLRCYQSRAFGPIDVAIIGDSHGEHLFPGLAEAFPGSTIAYYITGTDTSEVLDHLASDRNVGVVLINQWWRHRGVALDDWSMIIESMQDSGKVVFITDDVPDFPFGPEQCKNRRGPVFTATKCTVAIDEFRDLNIEISNDLHTLVTRNPALHLIETYQNFCSDTVCSMTVGDEILFRDGNHLNIKGSHFVAERLTEDGVFVERIQSVSRSG